MHPKRARLPAAAVVLTLLGGCATQFASSDPDPTASGPSPEKTAGTAEPQATPEESPPQDLWTRVREGFALDGEEQRPAVRQWVQFYASRPQHVLNSAERATPFLWHIVEALDARDMPLELALLPMVESGFDPSALSYARASGLWQFMPATARRFGLDRNWWYDERRDVLSSTNAALDYLAWLHGRFDDWLLALAAYNAGEGRVDRAVARAERAGKPTDFWHLDLPSETENYVPKLLAFRRILRDPEEYALAWPTLPNSPQTAAVELPGQIGLGRAAEMIDMTTQALRAINPGFRRWATHPERNQSLLVPEDRADTLRTALREADPDSLVTWDRHRVARGEALGRIAARYGTSVSQLREVNNLNSSLIHPGDHLLIPASEGSDRTPPSEVRTERRIRIRSGDSLWSIARRHDVTVDDLRRWNGIGADAVLQPGQALAVRGADTERTLTYTVRAGDSLWSIATDFGVGVEALRRWNGLAKEAVLQPGHELEIRPDDRNRMVYYQVRRGDSLWSIASRFSVKVAELREWNNLNGGGNKLRPGQKLRIIVADATS